MAARLPACMVIQQDCAAARLTRGLTLLVCADMAGRGRGANPLAHVLQALGEELELLQYREWNVLLPEGTFLTQVGAAQFCDVLQQVRGPEAVAEWRRLQVRGCGGGGGAGGGAAAGPRLPLGLLIVGQVL